MCGKYVWIDILHNNLINSFSNKYLANIYICICITAMVRASSCYKCGDKSHLVKDCTATGKSTSFFHNTIRFCSAMFNISMFNIFIPFIFHFYNILLFACMVYCNNAKKVCNKNEGLIITFIMRSQLLETYWWWHLK